MWEAQDMALQAAHLHVAQVLVKALVRQQDVLGEGMSTGGRKADEVAVASGCEDAG